MVHQLLLGSHLSITGGLHNALIEAQSLGMKSVQIFTKNQRQWKVPPLQPDQVSLWQAHRKQTGMQSVVSHDSYLINLASNQGDTREKSIELFRQELLRCETLDIPFLVTHPGAHLGQGEDEGLSLVAQALNQLHTELAGLKVITCLEITAGQGTCLGWKLEHLAKIIDQVNAPERLGICLDTAHLVAAGYDLTSRQGALAFLQAFDAVFQGRSRLKVWHLNDSKVPLGSHKDRHEHIGLGHVSLEAFRVILQDNKHHTMPMIMETPKQRDDQGQAWDITNLAKLQSLVETKK